MVETISARPLTFDDIAALAQPAAEPLVAYKTHHMWPHLHERVTVTPQRGTGSRTNPKPVIKDGQLVGHHVTVNTVTEYGGRSGGALFTNAATEAHVETARGYTNPSGLRTSLFVAVPADHPDAFPLPLVPRFGSQVSVTVFLADVDADESQRRLRKALIAEFGEDKAVARWHNLKSRPVADVRVDVREIGGTEVLAANVLEAEASYYVGGGNYDARPATIRLGD